MPAPRKRPTPPARMTELLCDAKRQLLALQGHVTVGDFEREWRAAWQIMVAERAFPHATEHRRQWRASLVATKSEFRAAFVARPTMFSDLTDALNQAAARFAVELRHDDLPDMIIGAIREGYGTTMVEEDREMVA